MAGGAQPVRFLAGGAALALVLGLTLGTLLAVAITAGGLTALRSGDVAAIRFTVIQALVSALVSVLLAIPVARALARRRFHGRRLLITLLGAPFLLPVIVAVLGLVSVFGRAGLVNAALAALGLPPVSIYGPQGVILAHVFFNLPLATRLLLEGWLAIPAERFRLAAALDFRPEDMRRHLERPMLRERLPGAFLAIFLVCLTSFAVALTLGGGPRATTVELAIYQAFGFDFDLGRAALLALVQFGICALAAMGAAVISVPSGFGTGLDRPVQRWDAAGPLARVLDTLAIGGAAVFLLVPLLALVMDGAGGLPGLSANVFRAAGRSLVVAVGSALLTLLLSLSLSLLASPRRRWVETAGMLPLASSSLVMGTGLFILLNPLVDPARLSLGVTAAVNAVMALPFAFRILLPAVRAEEAGYARLAESLGLRGVSRLRLVTLPRLRRPLCFAGGLAAALSMGDLGVIALFARADEATLPLQIYRLMGAYRMAEASAAAVLLLALSFGIFWIIDRMGRGAEA
ncbi:ABC transporter permease [Haematobacter missouriensis]|uniref:Thiamine/thiamine pyrophosphate ABC transporter permease ThiP n=1 Tax=Haematobacter missouriensis TaxID=366616 RepID=A0ABX3ZT27_9RHOB|nr:thiamine/thiamine pyrophosphate ABC transporter permease ThiP [Haematobacter missouriensis]KFI33695.1 ABC transporter permease [Haematobacter missouriensis]OWJ75608.1 thiamine/thiamine pyrophosphate ABC transporter permease ThiP [Haematobacter missouriensis]